MAPVYALSRGHKFARTMLLCVMVSGLLPVLSACSGNNASHGYVYQGRAMQPIASAWIASELASASPRDKAILEDGVVTFDEYQTAILDAVQCADDTGATGKATLKYRNTWYELSADAPQGTGDAVQDCFADALTILEAWSIEILPTEKELQVAGAKVLVCLNEHHFPGVPREPSDEYFMSIISTSVFLDCATNVSNEMGIRFHVT